MDLGKMSETLGNAKMSVVEGFFVFCRNCTIPCLSFKRKIIGKSRAGLFYRWISRIGLFASLSGYKDLMKDTSSIRSKNS